jgi:hypothetical protein
MPVLVPMVLRPPLPLRRFRDRRVREQGLPRAGSNEGDQEFRSCGKIGKRALLHREESPGDVIAEG